MRLPPRTKVLPHAPIPDLAAHLRVLRRGRRGSDWEVSPADGRGRILLARGIQRRSWPSLGTGRLQSLEGFTVDPHLG
jgi:hypothetical protein